ncbi:MAG: ATP-binding protein [Bacteroidetes bacterium]|nr:ATP-binding protein [Bacteroidota bacterium]
MQSDSKYIVRFKEGILSRTEELHRIRTVVEDEAVRFGFDRETAFRMALAVDEACTNIIKHSYSGNPRKKFEMEIGTGNDRFVVVLTDYGRSFNPNSLPKLDMKRYFELCMRGGLGVHIIKLVMDDVAYHITEAHANELRLVKYLT